MIEHRFLEVGEPGSNPGVENPQIAAERVLRDILLLKTTLRANLIEHIGWYFVFVLLFFPPAMRFDPLINKQAHGVDLNVCPTLAKRQTDVATSNRQRPFNVGQIPILSP